MFLIYDCNLPDFMHLAILYIWDDDNSHGADGSDGDGSDAAMMMVVVMM